jgi:DNA-binding GntR family transcriptional regulator
MTNRQDTNSTPVTREVLSEQVKDRILSWILEGELEPGSRIVETRVARELGVSQAPVREALRDLTMLGFVDMKPHEGARVRKPTKEELTEAIEVRAELEALAGRLAAERRSEQCLEDLARLYAAMEEAADRNDAHDHALFNARFHARIVDAAQNRTLKRQWSMLEPFSRTYVTASVPGIDLQWLTRRHDHILEAIRSQDPTAAAETMRTHATEAADLLNGLERIAEGAAET